MTRPEQMYLDLLKMALTASCYDESSWVKVDLRANRSLARPLSFAKGIVRSRIMDFLDRKKLVLCDPVPFDAVVRSNGKDWPLFAYSMAGLKRFDNVQSCIEAVLAGKIPGDLVETGVWRGGMVIFMAAMLKLGDVTDRKIWAADSFEGMPVPKSEIDGADLSNNDYLKVSLDQVKANFARFGLLSDQVQFLKGWFCDSLPKAPIETIAILRLDGDLYDSTMDTLKNLYRKVSPGGFVIVDDYHGWEACRAAVTDFLKENHLNPHIQKIDDSAVFWNVAPTPTRANPEVSSGVAR